MVICSAVVRRYPATSPYAGQKRARTLARADVLPVTEKLATLGQSASTRVNAALCCLVGTDAPEYLEDGPRGPDAEVRAGRLCRVRADRKVPSRPACLVNMNTRWPEMCRKNHTQKYETDCIGWRYL